MVCLAYGVYGLEEWLSEAVDKMSLADESFDCLEGFAEIN